MVYKRRRAPRAQSAGRELCEREPGGGASLLPDPRELPPTGWEAAEHERATLGTPAASGTCSWLVPLQQQDLGLG